MNQDLQRNDLPDGLRDIPLLVRANSVTKVEKGWSREAKYRVDAGDNRAYLFRVRPQGELTSHREEFDFVRRLFNAGLPVPKPHAVGQALDGQSTWMLLDWVEGEDLDLVLPTLNPKEQYALGVEAGRVLRAIHSTKKAQRATPSRDIREKSLAKIKKVEEAGLKLQDGELVAAFARKHLHWLGTQELGCQHGDFHPGNLVFTPGRSIAVIDFNRWDIGDPVEEFYKIQSFTIENSLPFARGQLHGYFDGDPDQAFWQSLAVHVAVASLYSVRWAHPFGEMEVQGMVARYDRAIKDYQGFTRLVPAWYEPFIKDKTIK